MILCIVSIIFLLILTIIFLTILSTPYYYEYYIINKNYKPLSKYLKLLNSNKQNQNIINNYKVVFLFSHDYFNLPKSAEYTIKIVKDYCKKYNYEVIIKNHYPNNSISPYWLRVYDLIELSNKYDEKTLFVYLDLDATINPKYFNIKIEDLINSIDSYNKYNYDIYIGKDNIKEKFINTGVMFLKNTLQTKNILQQWIKMYNKNNWIFINNKWKCYTNINYTDECIWAGKEYEQGALDYLYINNINNLRKYIKILHMSFCSNRYYNYDSFIYHFMAHPETYRLDKMKHIYFNLKFPNSYKEYNLFTLLKNPDKILEDNINKNIIPNILFQTYYNKTVIPNYILENVQLYAKNYKYYLLDDNDALKFLNTYFDVKIVNKFNNLKLGAHKADLLRYCLLYIYGGIYIDIKTILIKNLDDIFVNKSYFYTCLSINKKDLYQGIIASPPQNIIFLALINFIVNTRQNKIDNFYSIFVKDMYFKILSDLKTKKINLGLNNGINNNYYIFEEKCISNSSELCLRPDRYNLCCSIYDNDKKIFIGRDPTFPWK